MTTAALITLEDHLIKIGAATTRGTKISHSYVERAFAVKRGIPLEQDGYIWCLRLGNMGTDRDSFYGLTIEDCIERANEFYEVNRNG